MKMKAFFTVALLILLTGCVYVPENAHQYDTKCNVMRKKKVLAREEAVPMANCSNEACALLMASYGLVTAASFVVSGSIVVISNTVYWLEKPSDCKDHNQGDNS
jgi:hypothetical protein